MSASRDKNQNQGDIIFFETGESGTHQLYNHTSIPCRYLDVKTQKKVHMWATLKEKKILSRFGKI